MAKGRKLTASRSEMFLGSHSYNHGQETADGGALELREEEVWSMVDSTVNGVDHLGNGGWRSRGFPESSASFSSYSTPRPPPRSSQDQVGGLSMAFDDCSSSTSSQTIMHPYRPQDSLAESHHVATSAPVNVPDWSKIYRVNSVESLHYSDDELNNSKIVPPHEYLAHEYARSRNVAANSVFEGVGRTLKGRDLSRVRDAVWSQTGFDG